MRKYLFASLLLLAGASASAQQINPMTQAVLESYKEILASNPKDYQTLYQRASQYYRLGMVEEALSDLVKAVDYTPAKETATLASEYSLLSAAYSALGNYDKALEAVNKALEYNPSSYADLYKRGDICLELGKPEEAYRSFQQMLRLKTRSQEAFFGMAKALIMQDKRSEAEEMINHAKESAPANAQTYCLLGDLYAALGDNPTAAANYLNAFSVAEEDEAKPIQSLVSLAYRDYPAVSSTLDAAIEKSSAPLSLIFLKANLAANSGNYAEAYAAFKPLIEKPETWTDSLLARMAETCIALEKFEEALNYAALAVKADAAKADNYVVKAAAERAAGNVADELASAKQAAQLEPDNSDARKALAIALIDNGSFQQAADVLAEQIMTDPGDPLPLMLRAWLLNTKLNNGKQAVADYQRVAASPADAFPAIAYKALATTLNGKRLDGDGIVSKALGANVGPEEAFYAAVYYAQTGQLEKAQEWRKKAGDLGYQNLHNLNSMRLANLDLAPISHLK